MAQQSTNNNVEKTLQKGQIVKDKSEPPKFPRFSLLKVLKIAQSIETNNAGNPYDRIDLAKSTDLTPSSSNFRMMIIASTRYGLTRGNYSADKIELTPLGSSIVAPTTDGQKTNGLRNALLNPPLFKDVYTFFDKKQIPREELFKNTLKKEFKVATDDVDLCYGIIMQNMTELNLIQEIKGNTYLQLDKLGTRNITVTETSLQQETIAEPQAPDIEPPLIKIEEKQIPKQIFVAHGKNTKPLEQLKTILTQFKIPYQVAIDDAHKGRPISEKVAQLMRDCTSGIFIFTADEETTDQEGNKVLRPSDNVVFELGAGTVLYGNKIVIFREEGVDFGSDFTDIGRITFEKDRLDAKSFELMKELISLGFLQVSPT